MKKSLVCATAFVLLLGFGPAHATLTFYADRASFDAANPGLPLEDFEAANIAPGESIGIPSPLDSSTNNATFSPGDVLDGFQLVTTAGDVFVGGDGVGGNSTKHVSSNFFAENIDLLFSPAVVAVGMDLDGFEGSLGDWVIDVYGSSGLLGMTIVSSGNFFGVSSDMEAITRVFLDKPNAGGVLDNLAFGGTVPEPTTLLLLGLGLAGLGFARKRQH